MQMMTKMTHTTIANKIIKTIAISTSAQIGPRTGKVTSWTTRNPIPRTTDEIMQQQHIISTVTDTIVQMIVNKV